MMKISVIVPVFNLENEITNTLNSIIRQTLQNLEIIAVDDGSSDRSPELLDDYTKTDPRVTVIHTSNCGVTSARLTGVRYATGDYIGFVDGDDMIDVDMYERLAKNAEIYHADISHCGYRLVKQESTQYFYNTGKLLLQNNFEGKRDLIEGIFIEPGLCNKIYRRTLFDDFLQDSIIDKSIKNNEDLLMNYYLFAAAERSVYEDFCPYQYIVRQQSASKGTVNIHKLCDPVKVAHIILQETDGDGALRTVASRLYVVKLIRAATFFEKKRDRELRVAVKTARKELRSFLPEYMNLKDESKKKKMLAVMAAYAPHFYACLHKAYLAGKKNVCL